MTKTPTQILKESVNQYGKKRKGFADKYGIKLNTLHSYLDNGVSIPSSLILACLRDFVINLEE